MTGAIQGNDPRLANQLDRREAMRVLLDRRGDMLLVTGLGSTTWDAAAAGDDARNFYLWGAMGAATMVGLGLAIAQPERRVLVVTGDGEMLMGLGALATIGVQQPPNLALTVFDKPADVSDETFYGHWYGHQSPMSEWMQPRTRYVRNAVVRALTPGAPRYRAIVEEAWPSPDTLTDLTHRADECVELERTQRFHVLQHGGLEGAEFARHGMPVLR